MTLSRSRALAILSKCIGNQIWDVETCFGQGVPQDWIEELADAYESGFRSDRETIYVADSATNQYYGVRDVDLAIRIGKLLGLDVNRVTVAAIHDRAVVQSIKDAVIDGE